MKRRIDEIPVSDHLDEAVAAGLHRVKLIHRQHLMKKVLALAASIAVVLAAFFTWGFSNPVLASQIPFIGHIFARNEKNLSFSGNYSDKVQVLDTETTEKSAERNTSKYSATDAGYTFTANEVFSDGASVYLGMTVNKDTGFGKVEEFPSQRYGETATQMISIFYAEIDIYADSPIHLVATNTGIEGTQISDNTFEGILKIDLQDYTLPDGDFTMDIEIEDIYCTDSSKTDPSDTNYHPNGNWKITSIPFTADTTDITVVEINDVNDEGFGIGKVIMTPYEVKVQSILPPLYASEEEILTAKREFAGEDGSKMSDEEIDDYVALALFGDYGMSLFDADGNALEFQNEVESNDGSGYLVTYSVKDTNTSTLYFYIGEGDHETIKETDQTAMEERAIYKYTLSPDLVNP